MTEPLPNWRSIWDRAPCRAVSLAFEGSWLLMDCTLGAASDGANTCAPFGTHLVQFRDYSVGSSNQNREPTPSVLSNPIRPPWAQSRSASASIAALANTSSWSSPISAIPSRTPSRTAALTCESHLRCSSAPASASATAGLRREAHQDRCLVSRERGG